MEEDNVKSLGEAEAENKALPGLHAKMRLETTATLQDLHEKLEQKQQNYEQAQKDQVGMMAKLVEEVENTSILAARDGNRLEASKLDNMEKEKCIREICSSQVLSSFFFGITFELDASRGNAKELTAELGALRERIAVMEKHNYDLFKSLEEATIRLEETKPRQYGETEVHQGASLNACNDGFDGRAQQTGNLHRGPAAEASYS